MPRTALEVSLSATIEREVRVLYEREAPGMLRYAVSLTGGPEAAQDAVQEAFLRFFMIRSAGQEIRSPKAWLFRVLHNHALDQIKAGARNEIGLEAVANAPGPECDPETAYCQRERFEQAVGAALSRREIECVRLRAEGLQYEEIAEVLRLQVGTVGALLARAHKKIRKAAGVPERNREVLGYAS